MTPAAKDQARDWPRSIRAFESRDFRIFLGGGIVSAIGTNMQIAALAWVVQRNTGSAAKTTLIAFIGIIPLLVLGPAAGVLADRVRRRKLLVVTNILNGGQAIALWAIWAAGYGDSYWLLFSLSLLGGVFTAIQTPAWQALPSELVEREHLLNAITLNSTQFNIARALGPLCAGLAIDNFGAGTAFLLNAMSYLAVIAALVMMSPAPPVDAPNDGLSTWERFREGIRYITGRPQLRLVLGLHMVFAFVIPPVIYLIPKLCQDELKIGASSYGVLLGVFGIGSISAALALGRREDALRTSRSLVTGLGTGGLALAALAAAQNYAQAVVAMIALGAAYLIVVSIDHGVIQSFTDDNFRGRVTSVWLMTFGACMPMGVMLQGVLTDHIGLRWVFGGDAAIIAILISALTIPRRLAILNVPARNANSSSGSAA